MLTIAVVGLGAAVGLALFAVLSQAEEKAVVRVVAPPARGLRGRVGPREGAPRADHASGRSRP